MAQEIERKFWVCDLEACLKAAKSGERIAQGYLSVDPSRTVRVRIKGERGFITIKGVTDGCRRYEWEKEIPLADAAELLELCLPGVIEKVRHYVPQDGNAAPFEVDVFEGDNKGLVVAEIELSAENEDFIRPSWLGEEVTSDPRYYNSALAVKPYCEW